MKSRKWWRKRSNAKCSENMQRIAFAPEGYYKDGKPVITAVALVRAEKSLYGPSVIEKVLPYCANYARAYEDEETAPDH